MVVPDNEVAIIKHLQGDWQRADEKVSFTITGCYITNIKSMVEISEANFLLDFNKTNLKWQLTAPVFGVGSAIVNFEKKSFTILIRNGEDIIPKIIISEVFHDKVWFLRLSKDNKYNEQTHIFKKQRNAGAGEYSELQGTEQDS